MNHYPGKYHIPLKTSRPINGQIEVIQVSNNITYILEEQKRTKGQMKVRSPIAM